MNRTTISMPGLAVCAGLALVSLSARARFSPAPIDYPKL